MHDFRMRELVNMAWACASVGQPDAHFLACLARSAESIMSNCSVFARSYLNTKDIAHIAWAFATAGQIEAPLFSVLAKAAKQ